MYNQLHWVDDGPSEERPSNARRFVLQRHCDIGGEHYDLRLEQDGYLMGWRIAGEPKGEQWATVKFPHPLTWLDDDRDAVRVDDGAYAWIEGNGEKGTLRLYGREGARTIRVEPVRSVSTEVLRTIVETVRALNVDFDATPALIADGLEARTRSIERLCGLGRELDGTAFDERAWRKALTPLTLDEIHGQLRAFEVRFDRKYPPHPVSRPERLEEAEHDGRWDEAMAILRG